MDIQTGSQSMVAYVWPVRSVYLPLLSTYSNYSFFLWRTRRGIDFSPPVSVFTYIIYNILYFQPPSYIYIYIVFLACGTGLWPAGRLMVNAEKIRDKSRDRFRPMTRDLVMGHPNWGIPGLALPKENEGMMQFRRVHITLAMKGDRILKSFVFCFRYWKSRFFSAG